MNSLYMQAKKIVLLLLTCLCFSHWAKGTTHTIQVSNYTFTPTILNNVFVGDTVRWVWINGTHTTTCDQNADPSTYLPTGAATWNALITSTNPEFKYKVTVAGTYQYTCIYHQVDMVGSFTAGAVTPVQLISFSLVENKKNILLSWQSANEENLDYYAILRSNGDSSFSERGRIRARELPGRLLDYNFTDTDIPARDRVLYYQLAMVDKQGQQQLSSVRVYKNSISDDKLILRMAANPVNARGRAEVWFTSPAPGDVTMQLTNSAGKVVSRSKHTVSAGTQKIPIDVQGYAPGMYTVTAHLNERTARCRLLIL